MPEQKTEELESLSNFEQVGLNRLYSRGRVAYGSKRNLSKSECSTKKESRTILKNRDIVYKFWPTNQAFPTTSSFF